MAEVSRDLVAWSDIPAALGLLSRVPVQVDPDRAAARGARAAWAWPLAGAVLGLVAALACTIALWFGLHPSLAAGLVLVCLVALTGAMHEDGLADCADGFWGGWTRARRLEIMKDSRIGAYGMLAIVLSLLLRWQALALILDDGVVWAPLIAVAAMSRAPMVAMMALMDGSRSDGLSRTVGRPPLPTMWLALAVALGMGLVLLGALAILVALVIGAVGLIWAAICRAKIGGQTGDTLGAVQQLSEVCALIVLSVALS